jgi:hypothetical protein
MAKAITSVGLDAHKVWIKVCVLLPGESKPVEWQVENEKASVRRMVRKVQRLAPGGSLLLRGRPVRLCPATLDPRAGRSVCGGGSLADSAQARRSHQDRPA